MKTCVTCHELKPLSAFNVRRSERDGRQPRCRDCCKEWYSTHREAHRANTLVRTRRVRGESFAQLGDYLKERACVDCREDDLRVLDFDHRPGEVKANEVAQMIRLSDPWELILIEIAKCDVRCGNCHRRRTAERGGWLRQRVYVEQSKVGVAAAARIAVIFGARSAETRGDRPATQQGKSKRARDNHGLAVLAILLECSCIDCCESDMRVLEFDHRPGTRKVTSISLMVQRPFTWAEIEEEMAKCDVRCVNCHRRRTAERAGWWRQAVFEERASAAAKDSSSRLAAIFPAAS